MPTRMDLRDKQNYFPFIRLPSEIRNIIYFELVGGYLFEDVDNKAFVLDTFPRHYPSEEHFKDNVWKCGYPLRSMEPSRHACRCPLPLDVSADEPRSTKQCGNDSSFQNFPATKLLCTNRQVMSEVLP